MRKLEHFSAFIFYVKSIFEILEVLNMQFVAILMTQDFDFLTISAAALPKCKNLYLKIKFKASKSVKWQFLRHQIRQL